MIRPDDPTAIVLNQIVQGANVMLTTWKATNGRVLDESECSQLWALFQKLDEECQRINGKRIKK